MDSQGRPRDKYREDSGNSGPLRGRVFRKVRDDILSGRYREGEELKETAIGEEMGVSRTPVREAFRQLELEGLINLIPNKGAYVTGITTEDISDVYMIRSRLEGLAASLACTHISKEQLEELEETVYLAEFHTEKGHLDQLAGLDSRFHEIIYESCDSKLLERMLKELHQYVINIRQKTLSKTSRSDASNREHKAIMEAIKNGDSKEAEELSHKHVLNAYENMVEKGYVNGGKIE
ncbi:MAG: GntR family transcriptional regulator [Lachnospiraceae bacterium]|nr:GntR family transcriptional regulator [Lachnospiraceae bacterium]